MGSRLAVLVGLVVLTSVSEGAEPGATGVISGRLIGVDGQPVKDFWIGSHQFHFPDGRFRLSSRTGEQTFAFDTDDYAQHVVQVHVKTGPNNLGDLRLSKGYTLTGRIVDAQTGDGVEGALVDLGVPPTSGPIAQQFLLREERGAVRTDETGRFSILADHASTLISVTHGTHVSIQQPLGRKRPVEIALDRGGTAAVIVLGRDGKPLTGVDVWGIGPDGRSASVKAPGTPFAPRLLEVLAPGQWMIAANRAGVVIRPVLATIESGTTTEVTLQVATDGVSVTLVSADPLAPGDLAPQLKSGRLDAQLIAGRLPVPLTPRDLELVLRREVVNANAGRFTNVHPGTWTVLLSRVAGDRTELMVLPLEVHDEALNVTVPTMGWFVAPVE